MTIHSEADSKPEILTELDTEVAPDIAADLEAGSPTTTLPELHCSYSQFAGQILLCLVVFSAVEVFMQAGILGVEVLWPAIVISLSARIAITYISLKSALSASARSEVWQALKTGYIRGKQVTEYLSIASVMMQCYSLGWTVISLAMTSKWEICTSP